MYLGTAEGDFSKRCYNYKKSFNNKASATDTTLSKHIWELKEETKFQLNSNMDRSQVCHCHLKVPPYSNIFKAHSQSETFFIN